MIEKWIVALDYSCGAPSFSEVDFDECEKFKAFHTILGLAQTKLTIPYVGRRTRLPRTRQTANADDGIRNKSVDRLPGNGSIQAGEFVNKWIDLLDVTKCKP